MVRGHPFFKNYHATKFEFFDYPAVIDFSQKIEFEVMRPNHGGDTLRSILGPMGSHWVQKMGLNEEDYHAPKFEFSTTLRSSIFLKKMDVAIIAPNHDGDPLGSILGPIWSHCVKKMGQNRKKVPCPQNRLFDYPAVIDFSETMDVTVMAPNHGGDPLGFILGPMGSHWVKKWVKTVKNYHAPKFEFSTTPRSSIFPKKWKLRLRRQIKVGTP